MRRQPLRAVPCLSSFIYQIEADDPCVFVVAWAGPFWCYTLLNKLSQDLMGVPLKAIIPVC